MAIYISLGIIFLWLVLISWMLFKTQKHYHNLILRTKKQTIDEILEQLISNDKKFSEEIERITKTVKEIIEQSRVHFQKVGLVRFNPFERSGGEQSFVLALLNNLNSGLVINFIYTREGLRTYIKKVKAGKGEKYELSEEEKEAIDKSTYF
ncbi:hypothetical protein A3C98_05615 [Candidatus Roizmanbacteria bacterium RIFCSPHIGHO2_02_FULL_37_15]|uniref:DUF4446 domain-containing protein n=1 Tax=Candidatus Roizmanbacteria bacterium RIFCSPLOWO2_01_FULL_37_16 TaxID=1802058 RepID=A0A1F7IPR5_9BACT|nr:MAG: hypothetical protein A2859_03555 [Candidatus Roizmanbacteria bacterium RIFCSPHIGHO2_01_FULL_37_16b]OGK21489.1 MAG: hypothetical protein A3C98_05615 [Candidatus Roizmanbacteria bacterium RIFCSPHIGHO2_02_FULL_37_15]OGK34129.1 MAG: hypothetical protein A3F57_00580 [Candidatus Roizmanbacteria bacterium RIFCSPHIGHO2_12_FULL_36_11]OGK45359.1 MAG: hypothetical protein A3B40_03355 [Candidatus Roizmanbacteria bacterium RIFCSPLOWO2_01_FULL_37_16]